MKKLLHIIIGFVVIASFIFGFQLVTLLAEKRSDWPNFIIHHPNGDITTLACTTGSGILTCSHDDLYLSVEHP